MKWFTLLMLYVLFLYLHRHVDALDAPPENYVIRFKFGGNSGSSNPPPPPDRKPERSSGNNPSSEEPSVSDPPPPIDRKRTRPSGSDSDSDSGSINPVGNPSSKESSHVRRRLDSSEPSPINLSKTIIALGDTHGDFHALKLALQTAKLIDSIGNWAGGDTVLVLTGDYTDFLRSPAAYKKTYLDKKVKEDGQELAIFGWLFKLQDQAKDAKGSVELCLGNHELMNVKADFRYVSPGSFKDFIDPDATNLESLIIDLANYEASFSNEEKFAAFHDNNIGPLYQARAKVWSPGSKFTKILAERTQLIAAVDDIVFAHGGISTTFVKNFGMLFNAYKDAIDDNFRGAMLKKEKDKFYELLGRIEVSGKPLASSNFLEMMKMPTKLVVDLHVINQAVRAYLNGFFALPSTLVVKTAFGSDGGIKELLKNLAVRYKLSTGFCNLVQPLCSGLYTLSQVGLERTLVFLSLLVVMSTASHKELNTPVWYRGQGDTGFEFFTTAEPEDKNFQVCSNTAKALSSLLLSDLHRERGARWLVVGHTQQVCKEDNPDFGRINAICQGSMNFYKKNNYKDISIEQLKSDGFVEKLRKFSYNSLGGIWRLDVGMSRSFDYYENENLCQKKKETGVSERSVQVLKITRTGSGKTCVKDSDFDFSSFDAQKEKAKLLNELSKEVESTEIEHYCYSFEVVNSNKLAKTAKESTDILSASEEKMFRNELAKLIFN